MQFTINKKPTTATFIKTWISNIKEDSNTISIPICLYGGFVVKKELEVENIAANKDRKEGDPTIVIDLNGNASGTDGHLKIEKKTKKVLSFACGSKNGEVQDYFVSKKTPNDQRVLCNNDAASKQNQIPTISFTTDRL